MTGRTGLMTEMLEELTATHDDVRYLHLSVDMLVRNDAAHEAAIESLRTRLDRLAKNVGLTSGAFRPCGVHQA